MARKQNYGDPSNRWLAGDATKLFIDASQLRPGDKVFSSCRETIEVNRPKLADQEVNLASVATSHGAELVGSFGFVGPGYEADQDYCDRPSWVAMTLTLRNRALKAGATHLLFESVDRAVRSPYFHPSQWPDAQARECDLREFARLTYPLIPVTDLLPSASSAEEAAYRSRRGQKLKGKRGGRPKSKAGYKKAIRLQQKPEVLKLHRQGYSLAEIARQTGVKRSTVYDWIRLACCCPVFSALRKNELENRTANSGQSSISRAGQTGGITPNTPIPTPLPIKPLPPLLLYWPTNVLA